MSAPAVAAICARLDGLPLAIELAAAQVKLLPPSALLAHLAHLAHLERDAPLGWGPRDLEERQWTVQRTIAWSYDLLSLEQRRLFRRLSTFIGGWTLEAAEAACAAPSGSAPLAIDVLAGLGVLVDHSLVQRQAEDEEDEARTSGPRFGMLHVIREYALVQLEASSEAHEAHEVRDAHVAFFANRARKVAKAALALSGQTEDSWKAWLARERDNLRAALTWASQRGQMNAALWIGAALAQHDIAHGSYTEARRRLDDLLAAAATATMDTAGHTVDPEARLLAVSRAVLFASAQQDMPRAAEFGREQLALARELGSPQLVADALAGLALLALDRGAPDEAVRYAEESLDVARRAGNLSAVAYALENLALARLILGELTQARTLAEEGLELSRRAGFLWGRGVNACMLVLIRCSERDLVGALAMMREGTTALRAHGGLHGLVAAVQVAACLWAMAEVGSRSARLLGAAETAMAHAEGTPGTALLRWTERMTAPARAALGEEQWTRALAAGRALSLEEALAEALDTTNEAGGRGTEQARDAPTR